MKKLLSRMTLLSLVAATASAATGSHGGPAATHFITYLPTGIVQVWFSVKAVTGIPACVAPANVGDSYSYVFDSTTPGGKGILAGLIAAHSAGEGLWFFGTGTCNLVTGLETLAEFQTQN